MHFKYLKYLAFALGGLSAAVGTAALYLYVTFDGARLAAETSQFMKQRYQRSLRFDGPVELSMFPRLVLQLPRSTLSGHKSEAEFLGVDGAEVSVRLLPLLSRKVVVDRLEFTGLRLTLQRSKDGALNTDDLMAAGEGDAAADPLALDIARIGVNGGTVEWKDERSSQQFSLSQLMLETGHVGPRAEGAFTLQAKVSAASPRVNGQLRLESAYRMDTEGGQHQARKLRMSFSGDLAGLPGLGSETSVEEIQINPQGSPRLSGVSMEARGKLEEDALVLTASAPLLAFGASGPEAATVDLALKLDGRGRSGTAKAHLAGLSGRATGAGLESVAMDVDLRAGDTRVAGKAKAAATWQTSGRLLEIAGLKGAFTVTPAGAAAAKLALEGSGRVDLARGSAAGRMDARLDDSRIQGAWSLPRLSPLAIGFDLDVDRLDVDRYLAARPAKGNKDAGKPAPAPGADRFDLSFLRGYDVDGALRFGSLKADKLHLERVSLPLSLHGGRLVSRGHTASLYGGSAAGNFTLAAEGNRCFYTGLFSNVNLAPLLRDTTGKESLSGLATLNLDVATGGESISGLRKALGGNARLVFRNGAVQGIDMGAALREWRGAINGKQSVRRGYREGESTSLSDLSASFRIADGVMHNTDLQARSPMLRITGAGDVDLGQGSIDYLSRVTLVVIPIGPDSGLLASLRGITVPVRVKGVLGRPDWHLEPGVPGGAVVMQGGRALVQGIGRLLPGNAPAPAR